MDCQDMPARCGDLVSNLKHIFKTPASRLFSHLAIIAGRYPCKPHPHLKMGFTAAGWVWREYPICSASGWMVSRVQYGESGSAWSECAATNETPSAKPKKRKVKQLEVF